MLKILFEDINFTCEVCGRHLIADSVAVNLGYLVVTGQCPETMGSTRAVFKLAGEGLARVC